MFPSWAVEARKHGVEAQRHPRVVTLNSVPHVNVIVNVIVIVIVIAKCQSHKARSIGLPQLSSPNRGTLGSNGLRRRQLHEVLKPQRASHQETKDRLKGLAVEWT
ncbi:hypothetical protein FOXG_19104 [Fusarium oxysporum f. sp. lycopersici 4287]|uniref:Uncharacterized protein n=2 Tax=Fusarium oxysporum TaxID=5507 RepID=A0A0J9UW97_FUSO4|nr:hypothetical protein FOXG_19104 [Fusarium oxysporum f. sp. lycopersici 4287]EXK32700.1 hypothetical protein FOMG_11572 [Fusarium oxysporum f. sp. melonis 26406]KNB03128.1 hypothetical protein FOXG_19104 [Fusarium oxysporum f. sp. lycopersici 4287]